MNAIFWDSLLLVSCLTYFSALKLEAVYSYETSVNSYPATQRHKPEGYILQRRKASVRADRLVCQDLKLRSTEYFIELLLYESTEISHHTRKNSLQAMPEHYSSRSRRLSSKQIPINNLSIIPHSTLYTENVVTINKRWKKKKFCIKF